MHRGSRQLIAFLLAAALLLSFLPGAVRAEETMPTEPEISAEPTEPEIPTEPTEPAESTEPTEPSEPTEPTEPPAEPRLYFGLLHSHTADSSGLGTPAQAYEYAKNTAKLDFLAVTDHGNSLDGAENSALSADASAVSRVWKQGREAAAEATGDDFLALYGFEMTWHNGLGHMGTFFTPGFQSREQEAFSDPATALKNYYNSLTTVPGSVSQFNHPDTFHGDFENFAHYSEDADRAISLIEVVSEGQRCPDAYTRALDAGWHLAPTASQNTHDANWGTADDCRTVVYADSLGESDFAAALANCRVYATEDADLEILYRLNGRIMGSRLKRWEVGETVTLTAQLSDPTDEAIGTVEVITRGGSVAAVQEIAEAGTEIAFELPPDTYYYLRITQPDGDMAVTAPVWIEDVKPAEITAFETSTVLAVSARPVDVQLTVRNREWEDFLPEEISFFADGQKIGSVSDPEPIPGNSETTYQTSLSLSAAGRTEIRAIVRGSIREIQLESAASLEIMFLKEDLVTTIVADGSLAELPALTNLEKLAARHAMKLVQTEALTAEILASCDVLLIPAPEQEPDEDYVNLIRDFVRSGRSLIFCGSADRRNPNSTRRLNMLLREAGLSARFREDTAYDPINNGGTADNLYTFLYNDHMTGITGYWHQPGGCTVTPGDGTWLVRGLDTTFSVDGDGDEEEATDETFTETVEGTDVTHQIVVPKGTAILAAREDTPYGGTVILSGGFFAADGILDIGGTNPWDTPNGNGALMESILQIKRKQLPLTSLSDGKLAQEGELVHIWGFVTAGTAVEANRFPGELYLQDETGGIRVTDFHIEDVSLGTPLELYLLREGDRFRLQHHKILSEPSFMHQPRTVTIPEAGSFPDTLVQLEGKIASRTLTADERGLSAFSLETKDGSRINVRIEEGIGSASTGENTLAATVTEGGWVSVIGIVYAHDGQTVLRVRNCDEITPIREPEKAYRVVKGEYTIWLRKDGKSLYMEVEGPGREFLGMEVDGERIDKSNYQTTEGQNLTFRIWPRYLRTLSLGAHDVVFKFRSGEAKATIVVWNDADSPQTGETILPFLGLMTLCGALFLLRFRRRKIQR